MVIKEDQLARFNEDYVSLKGTNVRNFVCPITLVDDTSAELCNGHILNKAIRKASRATIIQYRDVDCYFGRVLEHELVKWLNLPLLREDELFRESSKLQLTIPDGQKFEAFYASKRTVKGKYPQINLFGRDRTVVSQPFLKTDSPNLSEFKNAQVEGIVRLKNIAFVPSLVKSAYLALFRMFGYRWVFSPCGDKVRRALAGFYQDKGDINQASKYFDYFHDAVSIDLGGVFQGADTLANGSMLLHYQGKSQSTKTIFALTCLFWVNDRTLLVTLPWSETFGFDFGLYKDYEAFLANHSMTHAAYFAQLTNGVIERERQPRRILAIKSLSERHRQIQ